ncbi:MAG: hypothetical protein EHM55_02115 [Acidobacteria bacterium]|nr:MAG: hypothetical protein EHM55_02115 [Acidobacteriota bacterium]
MNRSFVMRAGPGIFAVLTIAAVLALTPAPAAAQGDESDSETGTAPVRPLTVRPTIGWETGYDDNVFRRAEAPTSDFVSIFSSQAAVRGRMRRLALTGSGSADWVHYASIVSERGANIGSTVRLDFLFNRLVPYVSTNYGNSRTRVNSEIDVRPRIEQSAVTVGGVLHMGAKTSLDFSAQRASVSFDETVADGVLLREALDRKVDRMALSLLQQITPLTRISISAERSRDRFEGNTFRAADNLQVTAGFESGGRIRGRARAGVQIHKPVDPTLPESRAFILGVGTSMTLRDRAQIGIDADRSLVPSYRTDVAYYESYGFVGSFSYAVRQALRFRVMAGRRIFDYRQGSGDAVALALAGLETESTYGSGVSYRLGDSMTIDAFGTYVERVSPSAARGFDGMRLTAGISHAF